jgi:hypothetical protein
MALRAPGTSPAASASPTRILAGALLALLECRFFVAHACCFDCAVDADERLLCAFFDVPALSSDELEVLGMEFSMVDEDGCGQSAESDVGSPQTVYCNLVRTQKAASILHLLCLVEEFGGGLCTGFLLDLGSEFFCALFRLGLEGFSDLVG